MKTPRNLKAIPALTTALGLAAAASAQLGPWPSTTSYMWETANPTPGYPVVGTVSIVPVDSMQMSGFTSGSKSTWLSAYPSYPGERMCLAREIFPFPGAYSSIHATIFDPAGTGKSGWAIIMKDNTGNIFDFGCRPFIAPAKIQPHQYDLGAATWDYGVTISRDRTGNDYYTMDFSQNLDGTILWSINWNKNGSIGGYTNTTSVAYNFITEVYLNVSTLDTSGAANYKWTEFSYTSVVPEPSAAIIFVGGLLGLVYTARRKRL